VYLTLVSLAIAVVVALVGLFGLDAGWFGSFLLGFAAFAASWILGARRLNKRLAPALQQVQRQIQAGHVQPALATLEGMLPLGRWMPLLTGQLHAQMGVLAWHAQQPERALAYLERAGRRAAEAQMLLASVRYREGKVDDALRILAQSEPLNRKHVLLHNLHAWLLNKQDRRDEAIAVLNRLLAKQPNEIAKDNLLRLQNGQKMNMRAFDVAWYALGFERPPQHMGEMRTARKGFRTPPKRKR
jgi:tetratricopeptide (TPR) repeat protein